MSGYVYPETPEQAEDRARLVAAGYHVSPPQCPDCDGYGSMKWDWRANKAKFPDGCPRGCETPVLIL